MRWLTIGLVVGFGLGFLVAWTMTEPSASGVPSGPAVAADDESLTTPATAGGAPAPASKPVSRAGRAHSPASGGVAGSATGAGAVAGAADPATVSGAADGSSKPASGADARRPPRDGPTPANPVAPPTPPEAAAASRPAPSPPPVSSAERVATGIVVDATTQLPIAGARVLFATVSGEREGSWHGDTTDAEGRFSHAAEGDAPLGTLFQLRVSKDGFERREVAPAPGEMRIELRPVVASLLPGRVLGVVREADGRPFSGEIEIDGADEHTSNAAQIVVADAEGRFLLEGVPAGRWRLRWRGPFVDVTVPGGGDVPLEFPRAAKGGSHVVTDIDVSSVRAEDPTLAARLAALVATMEQIAGDPAFDDATRERLQRAVAQEVQRLDADARAARPRRDVVVTGVATSGRAWMRLEVKPRLFRRVEVRDGAARFTQVPIGTYRAVLVEPGRPDLAADALVPPGDGPAAVTWSPD